MCGFRSPLLGYVGTPGPILAFQLPQPQVLPLSYGNSPKASWDRGEGGPLGTAGIWAYLEALVAPPGSSRQALGQLVVINSIDYLVVMPFGVRALGPAPQGTLLAGVQGFLGLNACECASVTACM